MSSLAGEDGLDPWAKHDAVAFLACSRVALDVLDVLSAQKLVQSLKLKKYERQNINIHTPKKDYTDKNTQKGQLKKRTQQYTVT